MLAGDGCQRVGFIGGRGADFEIGLGIEHQPVSVQDHGMIIHEEKAEL